MFVQNINNRIRHSRYNLKNSHENSRNINTSKTTWILYDEIRVSLNVVRDLMVTKNLIL